MSFQLWVLDFGPPIALNILFVIAALTVRVPGRPWLIGFATCRFLTLGAGLIVNRERYYPDLPWSIAASLILIVSYFCLGMFLVSLWANGRKISVAPQELFTASGRMPRSIFWMTFLLLVYAGSKTAFTLQDIQFHQAAPENDKFNFWPAWIAVSLSIPALLWMAISIHVKRLHDIGKSGWLTLLIFVPGLGAVATAIIGSISGSAGVNHHGPPQGCPRVEDSWQTSKDNSALSA